MTALILSGGGALGAFQVGAERYAREVKGYRWDLIAGVSIGAMNGAMLAMGKYQRLWEVWSSEMSNRLVYGRLGKLPIGLIRFRSLYRHRPRFRAVARELRQGTFQARLWVGAVSLVTGDYETFEASKDTHPGPHIIEAVVASGAMPVMWPPVDVGPAHPSMTDGGIRNTSPVGDVLKENPDELVIINCLPRKAGRARQPRTVVGIGIRSLDILLNEIFLEDLKEFEVIDALVKEADDHGVALHHPRDGRQLRRVPFTVIEPKESLGDPSDFSLEQARDLLQKGEAAAREALP
jgi:NTE family protein